MKWLRGLIYASGGVFKALLAIYAYLTFQLISDNPLMVESGDISPQAT